ncbi:MAG: hypothetical protein E7315_04090 [Clostridiales bacterium]|nr:hypothetical protein [Clostridiales bacterium]
MLYYDAVVFGGDMRCVHVSQRLVNDGMSVLLLNGTEVSLEMLQNISCGFFILPVVPADKNGIIFKTKCLQADILKNVNANTVILSSPCEEDIEILSSKGIKHIDLLKDGLFKHLNAELTGEAVLIVLKEKMGKTPFSQNVLVTGSGECALKLARLMASNGAFVTVAARNSEALKAFAFCDKRCGLDELNALAAKNRIIINTVPAMVLTQDVLCHVDKSAVIIDIASSPGGVDFTAARAMGIDAELYPGLPGRYFPLSAGEAVYTAIKRIMGKENIYGIKG